jgi:hypothetical protein
VVVQTCPWIALKAPLTCGLWHCMFDCTLITLPDQEAAEKLRSYADELEDKAAALDGE